MDKKQLSSLTNCFTEILHELKELCSELEKNFSHPIQDFIIIRFIKWATESCCGGSGGTDTFYPVTVSQFTFSSIAQLGMSLWQMALWLLVLDIKAIRLDKELHDVRNQITILGKDNMLQVSKGVIIWSIKLFLLFNIFKSWMIKQKHQLLAQSF